MHFSTKSYLKSNHYHTVKHSLSVTVKFYDGELNGVGYSHLAIVKNYARHTKKRENAKLKKMMEEKKNMNSHILKFIYLFLPNLTTKLFFR